MQVGTLWPQGATIPEQLWGSKEDLLQTATVINTIMLDMIEDNPGTPTTREEAVHERCKRVRSGKDSDFPPLWARVWEGFRCDKHSQPNFASETPFTEGSQCYKAEFISLQSCDTGHQCLLYGITNVGRTRGLLAAKVCTKSSCVVRFVAYFDASCVT